MNPLQSLLPGGWRRENLQVMRWLMRDAAAATPAIESQLEYGLRERDWELRMTAMLTAARLRVEAVRARVARVEVPKMRAQGVTDTEHRLLLALRDAARERLGTKLDRPLPAGVREAIGGDLSALPPGLGAFVHALVEPLPDAAPAPVAATGVVQDEQGPVLCDGHLLAWVPPIEHGLGDDSLREGIPNPVRTRTPAGGFYIDAQWRGRGTLAEARAEAARLAQRLGRAVALADPERWEMAARGPDRRRYPWGMNAERAARSDLSPWGMSDIARGDGEWLEDRASGDTGRVAGGARSPMPAHHWREAASAIHAYRFVYDLDP
jgi:hypothetical protein